MRSYGHRVRINILINLSSLLLCQMVQAFLDREGEEFATVASVDVGAVENFVPDKILVDAITLARDPLLRWPDAKLILIDTGLAEKDIVALLLTHKLHGVISTDTDLQLFRKALEAIREGQIWIDNRKLKALIHNQGQPIKSSTLGVLSKKEREIVLLVAEGCKNREIAQRLNISEQTVKAHMSRIFDKANVSCRSQLVPLALTFNVPSSSF